MHFQKEAQVFLIFFQSQGVKVQLFLHVLDFYRICLKKKAMVKFRYRIPVNGKLQFRYRLFCSKS